MSAPPGWVPARKPGCRCHPIDDEQATREALPHDPDPETDR